MYDQNGIALEGPTPLDSLDVDCVCGLLVKLGVENTDEFRHKNVDGLRLGHFSDGALLELGVPTQMQRDFVIGEVGKLKQSGVHADTMREIREAIEQAREQQAREQQAREQQAREQQARNQQAREQQAREQQERERKQLSSWVTGRGLGEAIFAKLGLRKSILTAAVVDLREQGLGDHDMHSVALLIKFNETLLKTLIRVILEPSDRSPVRLTSPWTRPL
jgi:hypothetical protein